MLGLPGNKVFLVDYDKEWELLFNQEKQKILEVFEGHNIQVHHIGSTAVKCLKSKPILDIAIEVNSFNNVQHYIGYLKKLNYISKGSDILPDRYYFLKGNPRTHQIHLFEKNNYYLKQQITFRDILRKHANVKDEYESLKIKLANANKNDKHRYTDLKTEYINRILYSYDSLK